MKTPKPEEEEQPQTKPDEEAQKPPSRVKITEVAKQMTECSDCKKPMNMKTLRYSHPEKCEGKPSDITSKPVRKSNVKSKLKAVPIRTQNMEEVEQHEAPPRVAKAPPPVSKSMPPPPPPNMQPYDNLTQAQLIQLQLRTMNQEILRRKQEKANGMCQAMFNFTT